MSRSNLSLNDVLQIVELIKSSDNFDEFHLKTADLEVDIKRSASGNSAGSVPGVPTASAPNGATSAASQALSQTQASASPQAAPTAEHTTGNTSTSASLASQPDLPADAILIKSPMVGTFYRASEPGAAPFVEIGQETDDTTTVCLIEVMKLINSIPAGQKGVVTHIYVEDGEPVEYGQALMALSPR